MIAGRDFPGLSERCRSAHRRRSVTTMGARESKPQQVSDYYELLQVDENATMEEIKVSPFRRETEPARHSQPRPEVFSQACVNPSSG